MYLISNSGMIKGVHSAIDNVAVRNNKMLYVNA